MATQKQLEANRRNARKSTGPRTPEGKVVVARNAVKHGLRSVKIVVEGERQKDFAAFEAALLADLEPVGALEHVLAAEVVAAAWRLRRARRVEREMIHADLERRRNTKGLYPAACKGDPPITLGSVVAWGFGGHGKYGHFRRYEVQLERGMYRALHELERVQLARKAREAARDADVNAEAA